MNSILRMIQEIDSAPNIPDTKCLPSIAFDIMPFISSTRSKFCNFTAAVSSAGVCKETNFCVMSLTVVSWFSVVKTWPSQFMGDPLLWIAAVVDESSAHSNLFAVLLMYISGGGKSSLTLPFFVSIFELKKSRSHWIHAKHYRTHWMIKCGWRKAYKA